MATATTKTQLRVRVEYTCPKCHRDVERINRTFVDRVIGVVVPIKRYKCYGCFWEGVRLSHSSN